MINAVSEIIMHDWHWKENKQICSKEFKWRQDRTEQRGFNTDITVILVKGLRSDSLEAYVGVFHTGRRF